MYSKYLCESVDTDIKSLLLQYAKHTILVDANTKKEHYKSYTLGEVADDSDIDIFVSIDTTKTGNRKGIIEVRPEIVIVVNKIRDSIADEVCAKADELYYGQSNHNYVTFGFNDNSLKKMITNIKSEFNLIKKIIENDSKLSGYEYLEYKDSYDYFIDNIKQYGYENKLFIKYSKFKDGDWEVTIKNFGATFASNGELYYIPEENR
ncbi:hypothetical protein [Campylobacter phage CP39]|nr:hypothetical protein [Campylobacter phage CP39]